MGLSGLTFVGQRTEDLQSAETTGPGASHRRHKTVKPVYVWKGPPMRDGFARRDVVIDADAESCAWHAHTARRYQPHTGM